MGLNSLAAFSSGYLGWVAMMAHAFIWGEIDPGRAHSGSLGSSDLRGVEGDVS